MAAVASGLLTGREKLPARIMRWWGRALLRAGGWTVRAEGLDLVPADGAIVVSNHQSLLDIPVLLTTLPGDVKFIAKKELGRIPVFGQAMVRAGNLLIDREDPRDAMRLLKEAAARIRMGQLLVLFPEGTRSADGSVGEFKAGAFHLARKAGAAILPVYIDGGRRALPKGSMRIRPAHLVLRVLPPIPPGETAHLSKQEMADETRRRIEGARFGEGAGAGAGPAGRA